MSGAGYTTSGEAMIRAQARLEQVAEAFLDGFAHRLRRVELRFLRQVADVQAGHRACFALDVGVDAGHDFQQSRFTGAV